MLKAGMIIGERYEVVGRIGSGGMADVYKAKDHKLNRFVAVKVLKQEFREDTTFIKKFQTEAQSAAGLAHPNIVNVYDVGEDNGVYFIVMELVEGITLKEYITKKGRLTVREATSIAIQVSMGLEAAHAHNIVHRDVKPQNIIISTDGKVKVTDFGIARAASSNTISSNVMGSVHYSSPEQVRGGYSDSKSDIYSLGITMYEMVTGRIPFDGDTTVSIAIKHLQDEMEPPSTYVPDLPHSLEQIIYKCTQKSVDRRYNNMTEVIADLKRSLIEPEGNFVTLVPLSNHAKTVMLSEQDLRAIQNGANERNYNTIDEDAYTRNQQEEYGNKYADDEEYDDDEYDDDDDEEISGKLEKALTIGGFIIGAIIIFILIFFIGQAAGIFKFGPSSKSDTTQEETTDSEDQVTVPNLLGKTQDEAKTIVNDLGLGIRYAGEEASTEYAKGQIVRQSVEADTKVDKNTTIDIYISSGTDEPTALSVPDVTGKTQTEAEAILKDMGLNTNPVKTNSDDVAVGNVISTDPVAGTEVKAGDTITLAISIGSSTETISVPSVIGMDEASAKNTLSNLGLNVTVTTGTSDRVNEGEVMDQDISAGSEVNAGTTITLTINSSGTTTDTPDTSTDSGTTGGTIASSGTWKCNSQLKAPGNYTGGLVKLELVQTIDGQDVTTELFDGQAIDFPYVLNVAGADGVTSGMVNLYEMVDGNYVERANYGPVTFKEVN